MKTSIQQSLYSDSKCFGCGLDVPNGLGLQSFETEGRVEATFVPWSTLDNGAGYLNGGIISTLLDCHGEAAVLLAAHRRGWHALEPSALPFVTANLSVDFLRPIALNDRLTLEARILDAQEARIEVEAAIIARGKVRARSHSLWKRWRPRAGTAQPVALDADGSHRVDSGPA